MECTGPFSPVSTSGHHDQLVAISTSRLNKGITIWGTEKTDLQVRLSHTSEKGHGFQKCKGHSQK